MSLPTPNFFAPFVRDARLAGMQWMTRENEVAAEARTYAATHGIKPASTDESVNGGTCIVIRVDMQGAFCANPALMPSTTASGLSLPFTAGGGTLYVPGAEMDCYRGAKFILDNLPLVTCIADSLDTHRVWQIFHPDMWRDENGAPPPPFTALGFVNNAIRCLVTNRTYTSLFNQKLALRYVQMLAAQGSPPLTIWPYHARLGSTHHPLMPILSEVSMFHEIARRTEADVEIKGYQQMTESYGICGDEIWNIDGTTVGEELRKPFINLLMRHKVIIVMGEASSHCVRMTVEQIKRALMAADPALVRRLHIMTDCMSPVPAIPGTETDPNHPLNFPAVAENAFRQWASEGLTLVKSTDNFLAAALAA